MKNLYKVMKHTTKEKGTDKVLSTYYSIGRYEKWFFNLIGPYVWVECEKLHYRERDGRFCPFYICCFDDYQEAVNICDEFNEPLIKILIKTYEDGEIVY